MDTERPGFTTAFALCLAWCLALSTSLSFDGFGAMAAKSGQGHERRGHERRGHERRGHERRGHERPCPRLEYGHGHVRVCSRVPCRA